MRCVLMRAIAKTRPVNVVAAALVVGRKLSGYNLLAQCVTYQAPNFSKPTGWYGTRIMFPDA